jgi:hypothetical protein
MKKNLSGLLGAGLAVLALAACSVKFSAGVKKDLMTGLKVTNSGLSLEEAVLASGEKRLSKGEAELGTKVKIVFTGVSGFTAKDGKVFPGASLKVTGPDGAVILENEDMYAKYSETGVTEEQASELSVALTMGDPMEAGKAYHCAARVWDKNSTGQINAEVDLTAKAPAEAPAVEK